MARSPMAQNVPSLTGYLRGDVTICFLILPKVHLLDLSGPVQVFYEASQLGQSRYRILYAGINDRETSRQGLVLADLQEFSSLKLTAGDFILIPGTDFSSFKTDPHTKEVRKIKAWMKEQQEQGVNIASVCSGSLVLAEAGLLNGKKCTTHWKCIDFMKKQYPQASVLADQLFVADRNVYTSAGMTSGIDMALHIVELHHGPLLAAKVAREMVVYMRRNQDDRQQAIYLDYRTHFNPAVHKVQDYVLSHPDKNPSLEHLASIANLSTRNLTRVFRKATGHSIVEFKNAVKAEFAQTLMNNSSYTTEQIAALCGFGSARHLRRVVSDWVRK